MERREETYHYYFYTNNGVTVIVVKTVALPMFIYGRKGYEELTDEQVSFYLANPTASVEEVRNCQLNEVVEVDDNLQFVKADAINELKSLYTSSVKVSDIDFAAAVTDFLKQNNSLTLASVPDLMDNTYSRSVIAEFATSYLASKALYDGGNAAIEGAASEEAVQSVLNDYRARFAAL